MRSDSRGSTPRALNFNALKPILRAYALGYVSITGPRLFSLLKIVGRKDKSNREKFDLLCYILQTSVQLNRFPTTCAIIVAGSTLLPRLILAAIRDVSRGLGRSKLSDLQITTLRRTVQFLSTFLSAWLGFRLLNSRRVSASHAKSGPTPKTDPPLNPLATSRTSTPITENRTDLSVNDVNLKALQPYAGKTMDLTLFTFTRACDVVVGSLWQTWSRRRKATGKYTRIEQTIANLTDAGIFSVSSAIIMWAWFYLPERLPRTYNIWISEAAQIDSRLIEALRMARQGKWLYGKDTGLASLLSSLCKDLSLPPEWGDPAKTVPIPCHLVHMHSGPNCEYHAISRFLRTFRFAISTYLPLQLALRLRSRGNKPLQTRIMSVLISSCRSSAFLSLFVTLFYYSVCLSRTRLGPRLLGTAVSARQMIDSGLCVLAGCLACGWSILVEKSERRQEIAYFVAPRALATVLPRRYDRKYISREALAFAASTAVVLTAIRERKGAVRGVLGSVLEGVMRE